MQDKIYNIDLDIRSKYTKFIEVNQGDVAINLFSITLKDQEEIYNLADTNISIIFVKSDLTQVLQTSDDEVQAITVEDNAIKARLKPQATTKSGKVLAEVIVRNIAGKRLVSKIFSFYVSPALFKDELLESNSDFEILTRLIDTVTTLLQEQVLFNIAENERVLNEDERKFEEVKRISLFNRMTTLKSELITLKENIENLKLDDLHFALTTLKTELEAIQVEMTNSIDTSIEATTQAIQAIKGANTATANTNLAKDEAIRETAKTKQATSDVRALEASVIEAEDDRVVEEGKRATAETTRADEFIASQSARASAFASKINEFIEETERVESLYPLQLNEIKDNLTAHKEDYFQQRQLPHFNHAAQEYVNLDQFWNNLRDGKIYTVEFNQFSVSPSSEGNKKDDNEGLVMEPSTNTVAGRDDYSKIGLFKPIEVNAYVDENDDYHVIAIQGDGRFKRDGTMGDVYIMNMVGYTKYVADDLKWSISYSDSMHAGFEVIQEAIKPDGTIRPYLLHAKYVAGRNPLDGKLASISGVYAEYVNMSHNGQITGFKVKGAQYSGKTSHDDFWVQLLMWLKYATTNSQSIMKGCVDYYVQYTPSILETDVKRFIVTNAQANNFLVGSTVSVGDFGAGSMSADRSLAQNFNIVNRVKILAIEPLEDGLNTAVVLDTSITFSTTQTTTIITYPWNLGGCDNVLGVDGSPYDNLSGKEPFIINGIEMMVGGYEILQNLIIHNNSDDERTDVYINYDCHTYATSPSSDYDLAGQLISTGNTWGYGSKLSIPEKHPSVMLITETEASSTTGFADGIYTNPPSAGGTRVWLSRGNLSLGALCGLRCLSARSALSVAVWGILGRLSATGRSRRRAGVN